MGNIITIWKGNQDDIPQYWTLCDGENGTPDLKDKFVMGAEDNEEILTTAGINEHSHGTTEDKDNSHTHSTSSAGSHRHTHLEDTVATEDTGASDNVDDNTEYSGSHSHSSESSGDGEHNHDIESVEAIPKHYKLAYIMADKNVDLLFPVGAITMWTGNTDKLPDDWVFCDGDNDTPDLRGKFIRGAYSDDTRPPGTSVSEDHSHDVTGGNHTHDSDSDSFSHCHYFSGDGWFAWDNVDRKTCDSETHSHTLEEAGSHTHDSNLEKIEPEHYKLAFIKKVA